MTTINIFASIQYGTSDDCLGYGYCSEASTYAETCDEGTLFCRGTGACVPESRTTCYEGPKLPPTCDDPTAIENLPIEWDCTKYVVCVFGEGTLRQCAAGMEFDSVELKCVLEGNAVCAGDSTETTTAGAGGDETTIEDTTAEVTTLFERLRGNLNNYVPSHIPRAPRRQAFGY